MNAAWRRLWIRSLDVLLARVIGTVHATAKDTNIEGATLLVIQPVNSKREPIGESLVAADMLGAGLGEIVCYTTAYEAVIPWKARREGVEHALLDAAIVVICDSVDPVGETH